MFTLARHCYAAQLPPFPHGRFGPSPRQKSTAFYIEGAPPRRHSRRRPCEGARLRRRREGVRALSCLSRRARPEPHPASPPERTRKTHQTAERARGLSGHQTRSSHRKARLTRPLWPPPPSRQPAPSPPSPQWPPSPPPPRRPRARPRAPPSAAATTCSPSG